MEKQGLGLSKGHVYLCAECFSRYAKLILKNPSAVQLYELPTVPQIMPLVGDGIIPCEKCKYEKALGYVPCFPSKESRERE